MPAAALSSPARAALRSRAQTLKAVLHVGKEGVTPALIHSVSDALRTRDLVKLKVLEMAPEDARTTAHALAETMEDLTVVQVMGRVVTLHRPLPVRPEAPAKADKPEKPEKPEKHVKAKEGKAAPKKPAAKKVVAKRAPRKA